MDARLPKIILGLILFLKITCILLLIQYGLIHLGPDEAQYWTWSRQLDIGYYSKPPGIAWQIWLGTLLFGQTELGVRIGAIVISILITIAVYYLARACTLNIKQSAWAAAIMALVPLGILSSLFAITDGGMVLFWTIAMVICVQNKQPDDIILGLVIALGALFKWPIYFFWVIRMLWGWFNPPMITRNLILGVAISLLGLIPAFIWNMQHDWVTFRHVFSTLYIDPSEVKNHGGGNPLEFLGGQIALLSPIYFLLLLISIPALFSKKEPFPVWFCGFSSVVFLTLGFVLSCFKRLQGNWLDFLYPAAIVWIAWYTLEKFKHPYRWLVSGILVGLALCAFVFFLPNIQSKNMLAGMPIPYRINPFRHNLGWEKLAPALIEAGYDPNKDFLFADKYQSASILSFYGPERKRTYFFNLHGIRYNQFSFWPGMPKEQKGKTGYFVLVDNIPKGDKSLEKAAQQAKTLLQPYFSNIIIKGPFPLFQAYGQTVKEAWILVCKDYNGLEPNQPDKF